MGVKIKWNRRKDKLEIETWGNCDPHGYVTYSDTIKELMDKHGASEFIDDRQYTSAYNLSEGWRDIAYGKNLKKHFRK